MKRLIMTACIAVLSLSACDKGGGATKAKGEVAGEVGKGAQHAAADIKPGSHEDWCGEHAVPESQCTRCDPALVPAFKATGDWCEEHALPESQCLQCNPDLKIERPPQPQGG